MFLNRLCQSRFVCIDLAFLACTDYDIFAVMSTMVANFGLENFQKTVGVALGKQGLGGRRSRRGRGR